MATPSSNLAMLLDMDLSRLLHQNSSIGEEMIFMKNFLKTTHFLSIVNMLNKCSTKPKNTLIFLLTY